MKVLRVLLLLLLLSGLAMLAGLNWIQTPAGAEAVSEWLTRKIRASVPGTRIEVEEVRPLWPPALTAQYLFWTGPDGTPILKLSNGRAALNRLRWPPGNSFWKLSGDVERLDLAALDRALDKGEWKADGFMTGRVAVRGWGDQIKEVQLSLNAESPGGRFNSRILSRLAEMLPPTDMRGVLLKALGAKDRFRYDVGRLELSTEKGRYVLDLLLDGDHLLALKVRVPQESMEFFLKETQLWR